MSDRVAVMSRGRVEQFDTPLAVYHRPTSTFVADFIGEANLIPCRIAAVTPPRVRLTSEHATTPLVGVAAEERMNPGDRVALVVRPEKLRVGGNGPGRENQLSGRIRDVVFSGPTTKVVVEVGPDLTLTAFAQPGQSLAADGGPVALWWDAGDAVVVRAP